MTPISACKPGRTHWDSVGRLHARLPRKDGQIPAAQAPILRGRLHGRGFTLLEIMLVLGIIALASVLVFPELTGLEARTFSAQVRQAHTLLNYARRTAVVTGQPSSVTFHVAPGVGDSPAPGSSGRNSAGTWHGEGLTLRYRDSTERESEVDEQVEITFFPEGGSTGGTLLLVSAERSASLYIDPITGRVESEAPEQ